MNPTTLPELLKMALASGVVGVTLRSGAAPVIYPSQCANRFAWEPSTPEEIDAMLRQLMTSREVRALRALGVVHFTCVFESVPLLGGAKVEGEDVCVELRRMAD
jgi:hypothetical protein